MEFKIDCSKWRCGLEGKYAKGLGGTSLQNEEGFMCCLGQVALQIDPDAEIKNKSEPDECVFFEDNDNILIKIYKDPEIYIQNTKLSILAMNINDNPTYTTKQRKTKLKKLFHQNGHTLIFDGKTKKYK